MAIITANANMSVLDASRVRIKNAFETGLPIKVLMSGGKDSTVLIHIIYDLLRKKEINPEQMTIQFIDEEAMFDDVIDNSKRWREKMMLEGVKFDWYCIQAKHFSCFNSLEEDESFILWDQYKKDVWVRKMPSYAIKNHPLLKERIDTYQQFLERVNRGCLQIIGVRTAESIQRLRNISTLFANAENENLSPTHGVFPIYDWLDDDIWLYLKTFNVDFPQTYLDLYSIGTGRNGMRISQFFAHDTAQKVPQINETQPDLMERILRREPNAYLTLLYWDTDMFTGKKKGKTVKNPDNENGDEGVTDYKQEVLTLLSDLRNFNTPSKIKSSRQLRNLVSKSSLSMKESDWKRMYKVLVHGDPRGRTIRALHIDIGSTITNEGRKRRTQKKKEMESDE